MRRRLGLSLLAAGLAVACLGVWAGPATARSYSPPFASSVWATAADTGEPQSVGAPSDSQQDTSTAPGEPSESSGGGQEPDSNGGSQQPSKGERKEPSTKPDKKEPRKPDSKPKGKKKGKPDKKSSDSSKSGDITELIPAQVSNLLIEEFDIPPYALQYYMAAGSQCSVPWELLAAIHRVETSFSTNLSISSAGAMGHMQFMPGTWGGPNDGYGVDADGDGFKDPYSFPDSMWAAACYLRAAAGDADLNLESKYPKDLTALQKAVFAYNHSDRYVADVLGLARRYSKLPPEFVNALVELNSGIFPVRAKAKYTKRSPKAEPDRQDGKVEDTDGRKIKVYTSKPAPVVAATAGKIVEVGSSSVTLRDAYGNTYYYGNLNTVAAHYPVPKPTREALEQFRKETAKIASDAAELRDLPEPKGPATDSTIRGRVAQAKKGSDSTAATASSKGPRLEPKGPSLPRNKERFFAHPKRAKSAKRAAELGQLDAASYRKGPEWQVFKNRYPGLIEPDPKNFVMKPLQRGARVTAGTLLGQIGGDDPTARGSYLDFAIQPAGKGSPLIDPRPMLKTWSLREQSGVLDFLGDDPLKTNISAGHTLLLPPDILRERVLNDDRIKIYKCGRRDIRSGRIGERVLGTLAYLAQSGFRLGVTSLKCGHGRYTKSGNVSHHTYGLAVDIAEINDEPVLGNQQAGGPTSQLIERLIALQGKWTPTQIISLIKVNGRDNTLVMGDHDDHVHVGFRPGSANQKRVGRQFRAALRRGQWDRLMERLNKIKDPIIPRKRSKYAIPVKDRNSDEQQEAPDEQQEAP